jgi:hypothetical protein
MRWSGLAIMDALTLRRDELIHDEARDIYRVITQRTKTGTDVTVPIPPDVAQELLSVQNANNIYFFWSVKGSKKSVTGNWGKRFIVPSFEAAQIECGHPTSVVRPAFGTLRVCHPPASMGGFGCVRFSKAVTGIGQWDW